MLLYNTHSGPVLTADGEYYLIECDWDELLNRPSLHDWLESNLQTHRIDDSFKTQIENPLPPIKSQELWAAGVTYFRSCSARMEEAEEAGGGNFYDRVYSAARPELFLKATPHRIVGTGQSMWLRRDSQWIVPEPELVLVINSERTIIGYTIGNDLSCRDIEGENPLYLPQAKTFDRCAAVGPGILVSRTPPAPETQIRLTITRDGNVLVNDSTRLSQIKRSYEELVHYLFQENSHPRGCLLMTGTGIVPESGFSLRPRDLVTIEIDGIGTLQNSME